MKTIEFKNNKGESVQWNQFLSLNAAKKGLKYVKANFSKDAKIVDL